MQIDFLSYFIRVIFYSLPFTAAARHRQKLAAFKHARFKRKQYLNFRLIKNIAAAHIGKIDYSIYVGIILESDGKILCIVI
jgi:hypothetical protein